MIKTIEPTVKMYDEDPYATTFQGSVVAVFELTDSIKESVDSGLSTDGNEYVQLDIVLDRTIFFPEEGGQYSDTGTMTIVGHEYNIVHVKLEQTEQGDVIHHMTAPIAKAETKSIDIQAYVGQTATGSINWHERYDKMQNHSGEHILSGIIHIEYGYDNVGFHLNDEVFTMDFNGTFTREQIEHIESRANSIVYENVPIEGRYYEGAELSAIPYRSKKTFDTAVRIVTVGDYDACACCAPHVRYTGEIGIIKIMKAESWKGGTRFTVVCGERAYRDYARKQQLLQAMASQFSTSEEKLLDIIDGMKKSVARAEYELSLHQTESLYKELIGSAEDTSHTPVIVFTDMDNAGAIRNAVDKAMSEWPECVFGAMSGDDESGYRYLIGSRNVDVKATVSETIATLGGKGGGNKDMIQGMLKATKEQIVGQLLK